MEAKDVIEYDDDGGHNGQSRNRKEPDSGRDEDSNSLNLANLTSEFKFSLHQPTTSGVLPEFGHDFRQLWEVGSIWNILFNRLRKG